MSVRAKTQVLRLLISIFQMENFIISETYKFICNQYFAFKFQIKLQSAFEILKVNDEYDIGNEEKKVFLSTNSKSHLTLSDASSPEFVQL